MAHLSLNRVASVTPATYNNNNVKAMIIDIWS